MCVLLSVSVSVCVHCVRVCASQCCVYVWVTVSGCILCVCAYFHVCLRMFVCMRFSVKINLIINFLRYLIYVAEDKGRKLNVSLGTKMPSGSKVKRSYKFVYY